jgi:hypothetical protein
MMALAGCERSRASEASTTASPSGPSAVVSAAPVPVAPPAFHLVARSTESASAWRAGAIGLFASGRLLYRLDGAGIHQDLELMHGIRAQRFEHFRGWGDPSGWMFLEAREAFDRAAQRAPFSILRHTSDRWTLVESGARHTRLVVDWTEHRPLGIKYDWDRLDYAFAVLEGKGPVTLPTPTTTGAADDAVGACRSKILPSEALGFASGDVFVVGPKCEDGPSKRGLAVERFSAAAPQGTVDTLEADTHEGSVSIAGPSADEVYVLRAGGQSGSALYRFDGKAWKEDALPAGAQVASPAVVAADGVLWVGSTGAVHRRARARPGAPAPAWETLTLPAQMGDPLVVRAIVPLASGAYVLAGSAAKPRLFGPKAPGEVVDLPSIPQADEAGLGSEALGFQPVTPLCESIIVPLQTHVGVGQRPFAVDALKDAPGLEGVTFVIADAGNTKMLEAKAPTLAAAKAVVEHVKEKGLSTIARPVCHVPKNAVQL